MLDVFLLDMKIVWSNCHICCNVSALLLSDLFFNNSELFFDLYCGVFSCGIMGQLCDRCSLVIPVWDNHPTCVKCRLSAGICTSVILTTLARFVRTGRLSPGETFGSPSEKPGRNL